MKLVFESVFVNKETLLTSNHTDVSIVNMKGEDWTFIPNEKTIEKPIVCTDETDTTVRAFFPIVKWPNPKYDGDDAVECVFILKGHVPESILTGQITIMADDDYYINHYFVSEFEEYCVAYSEEENTTILAFYTGELPEIIKNADPEPEPPVEPENPEPTEPDEEEEEELPPLTPEQELEAQKQLTKSAIITMRDSSIVNGIYVETSYGCEHFTLSERDQILLLGINSMTAQGITSYPYHSLSTSDSDGTTKLCTMYSDDDLRTIAMQAFAHITFHESYSNILMQWIDMCDDLETLKNDIKYGAVLPDELMEYLAMLLTASGLDPYMIPGYEATHPYVPPYYQHVIPADPSVSPSFTERIGEENRWDVVLYGAHVTPTWNHDIFGELGEDVDLMEVTVDFPVPKGSSFTVSQVNPALSHYADDPSVYHNEETDVWIKTKSYTYDTYENTDDPDEHFQYSFLVGPKNEDNPIILTIEMADAEDDDEPFAIYWVNSELDFIERIPPEVINPQPEPDEGEETDDSDNSTETEDGDDGEVVSGGFVGGDDSSAFDLLGT